MVPFMLVVVALLSLVILALSLSQQIFVAKELQMITNFLKYELVFDFAIAFLVFLACRFCRIFHLFCLRLVHTAIVGHSLY
jgi:hypothetical protein